MATWFACSTMIRRRPGRQAAGQPRRYPAFTTGPAGSDEVPSQPAGKKLHQLALDSFLRMREAALAEGVALVVGAGWRSAATAAHNAEASGNAGAVAHYSSHTLGLAVDLDMDSGDHERDTPWPRPGTRALRAPDSWAEGRAPRAARKPMTPLWDWGVALFRFAQRNMPSVMCHVWT